MILADLAATPFAQAVAWALVHFLWQGALLGLAAVLAMRFAGRTPTSRYAIGVVTLALMLAAPILTTAITVRGTGVQPDAALQPDTAPAAIASPTHPGTSTAGASVLTPPATPATGTAPSPMLQVAVLTIWLAGVVVLSARLIGGWYVAHRLGRQATRDVRPELATLARRIAGRLALDRAVRLLESTRVAVPVTVGWMSPVVLLPAAALAGLSPAQIEALLAHELAHVRRHDYLVNLLQSAVETLLFYHPAVWWVSRQVRIEREHCCDDLALGLCDRVVYATALSDLAALTTPRLALAATGGSLLGRVRRILGQPDRATELGGAWTPAFAMALMTGLIMPAAGGATLVSATAPAVETPAPIQHPAALADEARSVDQSTVAVPKPDNGLVLHTLHGDLDLTRYVLRLDEAGVPRRLHLRLTEPLRFEADVLLTRQSSSQSADQAAAEEARRRAAEQARAAADRDQRAMQERVREVLREIERVSVEERRLRQSTAQAETTALAAEYDALKRRYEAMQQAAGTDPARQAALNDLKARLEVMEAVMTDQRRNYERLRATAEDMAQRAREIERMRDAEQDVRRIVERRDADAAAEERRRLRRPMDASEKVQAADLLVIEISGEPDLPVNYTVRSDGTIRLPFLGSIKVEGQTAAQVRESIGKVLSDRKLGSVSQVTVTHRR